MIQKIMCFSTMTDMLKFIYLTIQNFDWCPQQRQLGALKEINHRQYEQEPSNYEAIKQKYNFLPFSRPNLSIILSGLPVDQDEFNVIKSNN